jgi:hypothetical protein
MRIALAMLMTIHGMAHLVGVAEAWRLGPPGFPYRTTLLAGHVHLGEVSGRAFGFVWLALAIAFVSGAVGAVGGAPWWPQATLGAAIASLALTVAEWPEARPGVRMNVGIITVLVAGRLLGWF